ncbi:hypothetical protein PROFUN_00161 [Planoprotostelium fungivorum]|uniref:Uncharacterized protein n=1 Tax=Planoprotostelium fungivorum TaxID=1890364 RepID=A0A2P6P0V6_9EUKA|nr:hypothetical protein PROFUN_00161 [Planoprotostelium fungivorum]
MSSRRRRPVENHRLRFVRKLLVNAAELHFSPSSQESSTSSMGEKTLSMESLSITEKKPMNDDTLSKLKKTNPRIETLLSRLRQQLHGEVIPLSDLDMSPPTQLSPIMQSVSSSPLSIQQQTLNKCAIVRSQSWPPDKNNELDWPSELETIKEEEEETEFFDKETFEEQQLLKRHEI